MDTRKSPPGAATPQQAERSKSNTPHAFPRLPYVSSLSRRSSYGKQKPQPRPYARQVQYYKLMRTLLRRWQACKERGLSQDAAWHARAFIRIRLRIASQMGTQWESWIVWGSRLAILEENDRKESEHDGE